jgi:OOP family OmpA-OmpF porin
VRRFLLILVVPILVVALGACGHRGADGRAKAARPATSTTAAAGGGTISRDGLIGLSNGLPFRLQVEGVERFPAYALVRFAVTNTTRKEEYTGDGFGGSIADGSMGGFRVVDPVGRKLYHPLRDGDEDGEAFGTPSPLTFAPGVRYEASVFFPPIPPRVEQVTVLPPGSFGELTGVPVVDGGSQPRLPAAQSNDSPRPGETVNLAAKLPGSDAWSRVDDLYSLVDRPTGVSNRSGGGSEVVALRTDVLFRFNSADLAAKAKNVLRAIADDMAGRADPAPSVAVTGHTDRKGTDAFNQTLSLRRAGTVRDALSGRLAGHGFHFQVTGKGESEPIAKESRADGSDNPEGRARNRRVEIAYHVKAAEAATSTADSPTALVPNIGAPAAFRADMGPVVARRTAGAGFFDTPMRLDVHAFYRDGAYLVADFELTNLGDEWLNSASTTFESIDLPGATYGSFTVVDPNKVRYSSVRQGGGESVSYLTDNLALLDPNTTVRKFVYYPAPPSGVTSVTLDAGSFGAISNLPIR